MALRDLRDDIETKYGVALRLHAGKHAAENAVDDGACVRKLDALSEPRIMTGLKRFSSV
jgi:hypothetical protein